MQYEIKIKGASGGDGAISLEGLARTTLHLNQALENRLKGLLQDSSLTINDTYFIIPAC